MTLPDFTTIERQVLSPLHAVRPVVAKPTLTASVWQFGIKPRTIPALVYQPPKVQGFRDLSDARRVELMLLPRMCFETVKRGASDADHPHTHIALGLFTTAMEECIAGLPMEKAERLLRRLNRESDAVYQKDLGGFFDEHWSMGKVAMTLFFLACDLTADGTMELVEGSAMADGLQRLWAAVEDEAGAQPKRVQSAERQAAKFRLFLNAKGYFRA